MCPLQSTIKDTIFKDVSIKRSKRIWPKGRYFILKAVDGPERKQSRRYATKHADFLAQQPIGDTVKAANLFPQLFPSQNKTHDKEPLKDVLKHSYANNIWLSISAFAEIVQDDVISFTDFRIMAMRKCNLSC